MELSVFSNNTIIMYHGTYTRKKYTSDNYKLFHS
jgi:hypothetical protein